MKITFKEFLSETILEDISIQGDSVRITSQNFKSASTKDSISTYFRTQPYVTHTSGIDADIFSMLNYVSSETSTEILKSLKGSGPYKVNEKQFALLMSQVKSAVSILVKRIKPDIIIYPKSKSPLLQKFVDEIHAAYPIAEVLSDAFIKKAFTAEDVEPLINTEHPMWAKFSSENPAAVKELKRSLKSQIKNGELELKKFYKPYVKFIKNFIELKDAYEVLEKVMESNVLVVDDILSSGSTMTEMIRQLTEFGPSKISGLTLFKLTTSSK
jgi:hypothetical protein